jgi:transcriptional regulator with XRE-family HTH domain
MVEEVKVELCHLGKEVGERVKSLRLQRGLSQTEFGGKLGKSLQTINRVERGHRAPDAEFILGLKEVFGADIRWVLSGRPDPDLEKGTIRVPLLKTLPSDFEVVPPEAVDAHIRLPRLPENAWAIQISGEDMVPTVRSGDYVVFQVAKPQEGDLALYCFDGGAARVRRFSARSGGELIAEAPGCPPIPVAQIRVVGRAVQVVRHIDLLAGR